MGRIEEADFSRTGYSYTLSLISGKYKMTILYTIAQFGVIRTNEMHRRFQDADMSARDLCLHI